jgi:hypothetical protein
MRVLLSRTIEWVNRGWVKPEFARVEAGMLTGEDQRRREIPGGQSAGDRRQLDRFGPGPDDQPDIVERQPSP